MLSLYRISQFLRGHKEGMRPVIPNNPLYANSERPEQTLADTPQTIYLLRMSMVFFALLDVAAHIYASPGATPIVSYWIDIETATYGLIAVVYLLGLRRHYLLPVLFTVYNLVMYFVSGLVVLPFGIDPTPLAGHVQFLQYSFGRGMSMAAWLYLLVVGVLLLKKDPGSKINQLLR